MGAPTREFDVVANVVGGRLVLVRRREAYELDDVAAHIWHSCDGDSDEEAIADSVAAEFDVDPAVALVDVREFVAEMAAKGLVSAD